MLMIRLSRKGGNKRPFYHIVATDSRKPRDSGYIERLGFFNPMAMGKDEILRIDKDRTEYWLSHGGKMSDRVKYLYKSYIKGTDLRAKLDQRREDTLRRIQESNKKSAAKVSKEQSAPPVEAPAGEVKDAEAAGSAEAPETPDAPEAKAGKKTDKEPESSETPEVTDSAESSEVSADKDDSK